jgi:hypothetical protein
MHLHTPASSDYQQPGVSYLDILKRANKRGIDVIAFTDHNTVAGYRKMYEEIEHLKLLRELKRILPEEEARLREYQQLLEKVLVLPGFEFTATFGFHILAIFPPEKPVREIEYLLLELNVPADQLDDGSVTMGASADVLTAYRVINEAGGMAIAAHANSNNGVAMRGFPIGGQTKIAYTQDTNLLALEVTDLEQRGRRSTASFFNGSKPEYPRRMHCIQGSDAHRLEADPQRKKNLGVGDRATELLLSELSFNAIRSLFKSNDFARTRPRRQVSGQPDYDFIQQAREDGSSIVQDFHENMTVRGGKLYAIIADVCAFANTNGGTIYVGMNNDPKSPVTGISNVNQAVSHLEKEISNRISPPLDCKVDAHKNGDKNVLRILVPRGAETPYAVDDNKIYVRDESETGLAVRDEIVSLVQRSKEAGFIETISEKPVSLVPQINEKSAEMSEGIQPPRTGVEVTDVVERKGTPYYTVVDLRNGNPVQNVTEKSARRLWHYAITNYGRLPKDKSQVEIKWQGNLGILRQYKQGKIQNYDLVYKEKDKYHFYFGVTEDGVHGPWQKLVGLEE